MRFLRVLSRGVFRKFDRRDAYAGLYKGEARKSTRKCKECQQDLLAILVEMNSRCSARSKHCHRKLAVLY